MRKSSSLPVLGVAALAAAALGAHLGSSAIAQIDPVHFQGPAIHPRDRGAAIEEPVAGPQQPTYAALYGWAQGHAAREVDCAGCGLNERIDRWAPPQDYSAYDSQAEAPVVYRTAAVEPKRAAPPERARVILLEPHAENQAEQPAHEPELEWREVERYASYPITEDAPPEVMAALAD